MSKMLNYVLEVSEFELQSRYYVHIRTDTLGKVWTHLSFPALGLNSIIAVLLQIWLWITHKGQYSIKKEAKTKQTH